MRITNKYVDRVLTACESDALVAEQFTKTIHLIDPPTHLLHPSTMLRIVKANRRHHGANRAAAKDHNWLDDPRGQASDVAAK